MLVVRSLRQDRVSFCVTSLIVNNIGSRFVEPPVLDMKAVSISTCPFIACCLSVFSFSFEALNLNNASYISFK